MRTKKVSHLTQKSSKDSSPFTLKRKLTIAFVLLALPLYHQEVNLLLGKEEYACDDILCEHTVMNELKKSNVEHADIVLAQSKLETGYYTSQLVRSHNNLFGFRTSKGYLKFSHWKESIDYYKRWQKRKYDGDPDYYRFLVEIGYAEDPNYTNKLKKIVNE